MQTNFNQTREISGHEVFDGLTANNSSEYITIFDVVYEEDKKKVNDQDIDIVGYIYQKVAGGYLVVVMDGDGNERTFECDHADQARKIATDEVYQMFVDYTEVN